MPRQSKRRTSIGRFSEEDLNAAITGVREKRISKKEASKTYNIGRATLNRYLIRNPDDQRVKKISRSAAHTVFTAHEETDLAEYVRQCSKMYYGLTMKDLQHLAFSFGHANQKVMPASWMSNHMAGSDWAAGFRKRHDLSLRLPENTSVARAVAFNMTNVNLFHDALDAALTKAEFSAASVWNLDETCVSTVTKPTRVVSPRGERQVGQIVSSERGVTITMCACVNASGRALAPALIFPRARVLEHWGRNAPPESLILANPSGWMLSEIFPAVLDHFFNQMAASPDNPQLLVYDNHSSHITLEAVTLARSRGVVIVTLPAHCSHRMQPLDVGVLGPWKRYYADAVRKWHQAHPGATLTIHDVSELVNEAFGRAFSIPSIVNAFRVTGIWPPNRATFTDADYMGAAPTAAAEEKEGKLRTEKDVGNDSIPGPSTSEEHVTSYVSPKEVRPFPNANRRVGGGRGRQKRLPVVLTSSPQKDKIQAARMDGNRSRRIQRLRPVHEDDATEVAEVHVDNNDEDILLQDSMKSNWNPSATKAGDWLLVSLLGGRRDVSHFRYVVQTITPYDNEDDYVSVQGYRSTNTARTKFTVR